jgi:hypothetical protein
MIPTTKAMAKAGSYTCIPYTMIVKRFSRWTDHLISNLPNEKSRDVNDLTRGRDTLVFAEYQTNHAVPCAMADFGFTD